MFNAVPSNINSNYNPIATGNATSWEDVVKADQTRKCSIVCSVINKYLKSYPNESFATVEKKLRKENCFTYLIASPRDKSVPPGAKLINPQGKECLYGLFATTKDKEQAEKDRIQYAVDPNPEKNLEYLLDTGLILNDNCMRALIAIGGKLTLNPEKKRGLKMILKDLRSLNVKEKNDLYEKMERDEVVVEIDLEFLFQTNFNSLGISADIKDNSFSLLHIINFLEKSSHPLFQVIYQALTTFNYHSPLLIEKVSKDKRLVNEMINEIVKDLPEHQITPNLILAIECIPLHTLLSYMMRTYELDEKNIDFLSIKFKTIKDQADESFNAILDLLETLPIKLKLTSPILEILLSSDLLNEAKLKSNMSCS